jgi:hypothetical protein
MIKVLLLTDTKSGHESVSIGFIEIVEKKYQIRTKTAIAKLTFSPLKFFLKYLINFFPNMPKWFICSTLFISYKINAKQIQRPDIIISTGGNTSFANILLSRYWNCINIYLSSLRGLKPENFTLIYSIIDNKIPNEIVLETTPVSLKTDQKMIDELAVKYNINQEQTVWALLIGGDSNEYKYSTEEYTDLVKKIIELAKKHGAKLLITTSRRTPVEAEKQIQKLTNGNNSVIKTILYNQKPEKLMGFFISCSSIVFCTEDSSSMITEVVQSQKPLYTLYPAKKNYHKKYDAFISKMKKMHFLYSFAIAKISTISLNEPFCLYNNSTQSKIIDTIKPILKKHALINKEKD